MATLITPKEVIRTRGTPHWHFRMFPGSKMFANCGLFIRDVEEEKVSKVKAEDICDLCLGALEVK